MKIQKASSKRQKSKSRALKCTWAWGSTSLYIKVWKQSSGESLYPVREIYIDLSSAIKVQVAFLKSKLGPSFNRGQHIWITMEDAISDPLALPLTSGNLGCYLMDNWMCMPDATLTWEPAVRNHLLHFCESEDEIEVFFFEYADNLFLHAYCGREWFSRKMKITKAKSEDVTSWIRQSLFITRQKFNFDLHKVTVLGTELPEDAFDMDELEVVHWQRDPSGIELIGDWVPNVVHEAIAQEEKIEELLSGKKLPESVEKSKRGRSIANILNGYIAIALCLVLTQGIVACKSHTEINSENVDIIEHRWSELELMKEELIESDLLKKEKWKGLTSIEAFITELPQDLAIQSVTYTEESNALKVSGIWSEEEIPKLESWLMDIEKRSDLGKTSIDLSGTRSGTFEIKVSINRE